MGEWKESKLGEHVDSISETYKFKANEQVVFLNTSDILLGRVINRELQDSAGLPGQAKKKIKKGDFLFSEIRPANGRYAMIDFDAEDYVVSTKLMVLRCNDKIDRNFFRIFLTSKEQLEYLQMIAEDRSGTFPQITFDHIYNLDIYIPPLPEQKAIASVLSSLDDKIDLLHRQNKTLEAMAETLFRQWFVEEAQDDWETSTVGDELQTELGGTPSTNEPELWGGDIPWINSGEVNNFRILTSTKFITKLGLQKSNTKLLPKGTTVLAITGATLGQVSLLEIETCANQSVVGVVPNERITKEYVFLWVKHKINEIILSETGGAQPHINKNDINHTELIIPNRNVMKLGISIISPLFEKITTNCFQIRTLEKLRDTLLPKLMSGEVRVHVMKTEAL